MNNNLPTKFEQNIDFAKLTSRLVSSGEQTTNVKVFFKDYTPINKVQDQCAVICDVHSTVIDCIDIYFGVRANQISEALLQSVVKTIFENYYDLAVEEIVTAYETFTPQKTDWRNVTKPEILKPIYEYTKLKKRVLSEYDKQIKEQVIEQERLNEAKVFYTKSCDIYQNSLKEGVWLGDCFNASVIYKRFRDYFTQEQKNELKKKASELFYKYNNENEIMYYAYSEDRILANLVVETAIKNKWHLKI